MYEIIKLITPAIIALAGTLVGGLITFLTTNHLKQKEWKLKIVEDEITKRENVYLDFIDSVSDVILTKVNQEQIEPTNFSRSLKLIAKMRLFASDKIIKQASKLINASIYMYANNEARKSIQHFKDENAIKEFSILCKADLQKLKSRI